MARAVRTAADLGASVINVSSVACVRTGSALDDRTLGAALSYAVDVKNAVVVTAAGNTGAGQCPAQQPEATWDSATVVVSPAWYDDYVLTVGSVNAHGEPSSFTLAGPWVDVAAPGEAVISLSSSGNGLVNALGGPQGPTRLSGTSYAAPVVSGLAALIRSRFATLTARQVMQRIKATAHHPPGGWDPRVGAGLVDVLAAVSTDTPASLAPAPPRAPVPIPRPRFLRRRITARGTRRSLAQPSAVAYWWRCWPSAHCGPDYDEPRSSGPVCCSRREYLGRLRHWLYSVLAPQAAWPVLATAPRPSCQAVRGHVPRRRRGRRIGRRYRRSGIACPRGRCRRTGRWRGHRHCALAGDRQRRRLDRFRRPASSVTGSSPTGMGRPPTENETSTAARRRMRPPDAERPIVGSRRSLRPVGKGGHRQPGHRRSGADDVGRYRDGGAGALRVGESHEIRGKLPDALNPVSEHDVILVAARAGHPEHAADRKSRERGRAATAGIRNPRRGERAASLG